MISQVEITNSQNNQLTLDLADPQNGLIIKGIEGLDPVKANIVSTNYAEQDGERYQASKREKRVIVLKLDYDPDYDTTNVRQLRNELYKFFMPKSEVTQTYLLEDSTSVKISGRVESFDSPLFVKDPYADITILCLNPDFVDTNVITVPGNSVDSSANITIPYSGTVDTGILFKLMVNRSISEFQITHQTPNGNLRTATVVMPLVSGDVLSIQTVQGNKFVRLLRGGIESSALYAMAPSSDWTRLQPGDNLFRVNVPGAAIPYTIEYTRKFGGL